MSSRQAYEDFDFDNDDDEPTPSRKVPPFFTPNDPASNPIPQTRDLGADGETSAASGAKNLFNDVRFTHTGGQEPEQAPDPATTAALPPLVILPNGAAFLQNQRLDAPASTVTETSTRLIASIFTTDCYEYTDLKLITWFRKNAQITAGEAPFFNTQALSKLMTKENPDLRAFISKFQSTFPGLDGLRRTSALISLSEAIFEHYQPSTPTIVKLCIHFVIEKTDLTDDTCNGLDSTVSVLSTVTDFIENYYQVPDNLLRAFENNEVRGDKYKPRPSLGGSYESQPGYLRLTADRSVFESLDTALVYTRHWEKLWQLLKVSLCAGLEFVPDIDLAVRRRVVNGVKTHPLKQQFTATGLEPARLWLARYKRADEAGRAFQAQVGFDCGLIFDDVGHISIAMDCLHPALHDIFGLVMMQRNMSTILVPRVIPELKLYERTRKLPECTFDEWVDLYTTAERIYDNQLSKKQFPLTKPLSIVSNLETKSKEPTDTDQSSSPVCRWCSGAHFTCDCPSDDRKNAGDCRLHAQGKCKKGRSCRYHHRGKSTLNTSTGGKADNQSGKNSSSSDSSTGNPGKNSSSNDSSTGNSQESSNETMDANGALVSDAENIRQKPDPDDYSKPQTRVCSYKECGKTFTIPLDGDNGTLWYQLRGLFLPRRCPVCIKDGKKNWTPQSRQKQSQLTQNGSGYGSMDDPEGVDSLVVSMAPDLIAAPFSNDVQVGSTADPAPAEAFIHHSEYIVPNELHGVSVAAASTPTAGHLDPALRLRMLGAVVSLTTLSLSMTPLMPAA